MRDPYSTGTLLKRALVEAPALRLGLWATLTLAMVGQAITVVTPVVIQLVIDDEILNPAGIDMTGVVQKASIALVALALGIWVGRVALLRLTRTSATGLSDLRTKTFGHILKQSVLYVQAERRGNLVSRVTSDISTLQDFMEWGGIGLIVASSQVFLATVVMFLYEWQLALIAIGGVVIYLYMMRWFQRILSKNYDAVRKEVGISLGVLSESITAIPVVRAYGNEAATTEKVAEVCRDPDRGPDHRGNRTGDWAGNLGRDARGIPLPGESADRASPNHRRDPGVCSVGRIGSETGDAGLGR